MMTLSLVYIITCQFPNEITPAYKEDDRTKIRNYRPVSLLPVVSRLFESLVSNEINKYIDQHLSKYLCGFQKGQSPQHCLIVMIENNEK